MLFTQRLLYLGPGVYIYMYVIPVFVCPRKYEGEKLCTLCFNNSHIFPLIQTSVNHTFSVSDNCNNSFYESGSLIPFDLTVTTQRDVVSGPMEIEVAIPDNSTNISYLTFVSAKVKSKGENNMCTNIGSLSANTSKW